MTAPDPRMIRQAALQVSRDNFFPFVWKAFTTLHPHPDDRFEPAWHVP